MPDEFTDIDKILGHTPGSAKSGAPGSVTSGTPGKVPETGGGFEALPGGLQAIAGAAQGVAGYAETPAYYAEKAYRQYDPSFTMPFHAQAAQARRTIESTGPGLGGEIFGTMAPAFIPGLGEMAFMARMGIGGEDLIRMAELARLYKMGRGAAEGLLSRPATTPEEAITQAGTGGLLGGVGAGAESRLARRLAEKSKAQAGKARATGAAGRIRAGDLAEQEAKRSAMRYTGGGRDVGGMSEYDPRNNFSNVNRFDPAGEKTKPSIFRDIPEAPRERGQSAAFRAADILGTGAAFTAGHTLAPAGFGRIAGHTMADAWRTILRRLSPEQRAGMMDYMARIASRANRRDPSGTLTSRAGAAGGVAGMAAGGQEDQLVPLSPELSE